MKHSIALLLFLVSICVLSLRCKDHGITLPENNSDTTSHNFTWTIETLGDDGASSALYDVALVNDTLAYAAGDIYLKDSTGQIDPDAYNAARWDGEKWQPIRIPFIGPCAIVIHPPLRAIWAFSPTDVLVTNGGSVVQFDGTNATMDCGMNSFLTGAINKIFAMSPSNAYMVGNSGTIVRNFNGVWQKIESGTTLDIRDVWGNGSEILAVASDDVTKKLLRIQGTSVVALDDSGLANSIYGVWFVKNEHYYVVGAGIHEKQSLSDPVWSRYPSGVVTSYLSGGVRGSGLNDVFVAGSFFEIVHYNGSTWHNYRDQIPSTDGDVGRVAVKGNLMITVGLSGSKAIAIVGRRN